NRTYLTPLPTAPNLTIIKVHVRRPLFRLDCPVHGRRPDRSPRDPSSCVIADENKAAAVVAITTATYCLLFIFNKCVASEKTKTFLLLSNGFSNELFNSLAFVTMPNIFHIVRFVEAPSLNLEFLYLTHHHSPEVQDMSMTVNSKNCPSNPNLISMVKFLTFAAENISLISSHWPCGEKYILTFFWRNNLKRFLAIEYVNLRHHTHAFLKLHETNIEHFICFYWPLLSIHSEPNMDLISKYSVDEVAPLQHLILSMYNVSSKSDSNCVTEFNCKHIT
ncbi:hypothetical protein AGLY_011451, partial [Aphis glycines]